MASEKQNYTVKITEATTNYAEAEIVGLPDVYVHFGHLNFKTVWNKETKRHDTLKGVDTFYGGMGEGSKFETWQDAIHASLYDAYQVSEELKDGDTFTVEYQGETARFACDGVHVVRVNACMNDSEIRIPKTIAEKVELVGRIYTHSLNQLKATFEVNRYGNMVERYHGNLKTYTNARNSIGETFNILTTNIYEGKSGSDTL